MISGKIKVAPKALLISLRTILPLLLLTCLVVRVRAGQADANAAGTRTFGVGKVPTSLAFDGANIWVTQYGSSGEGNTLTVLRASDGALQATYPCAQGPYAIVFDGQNMWITATPYVQKLQASDGTILGTYFISYTLGPSPGMAATFG